MASRFFSIPKMSGYLIAAVLAITLCAQVSAADLPVLRVETETAVHTFRVEIMRTAEDRARGLMERKQLDRDRGMLFDFGRDVTARMWMKNTYIPLDMLFIRDDGTITNIAENTVPHSTDVLSSSGLVRYVLEINGGLSQELGISKGDSVQFPQPR